MKRKLVLYPANEVCQEFLISFREKYGDKCYQNQIERILSDDGAITEVEDKPVHLFQKDCIPSGSMILITSEKKEYLKYSDKLSALGLEEFEDYIWYPFLDKKMCLINGNCHGPVLDTYLSNHPAFSSVYAIHPMIPLTPWTGANRPLNQRLLLHADLFLYQHMQRGNVLSDSYADDWKLPKLSNGCIRVAIPNFFPLGEAIYQTQTMKIIKSFLGTDGVYEDTLLDLAYRRIRPRNIQEITTFLDEYQPKKSKVKRIFESCFARLREREKHWDIKIVNWMEKNYTTLPIADDIGHPSSYVMLLTGKLILMHLGLWKGEDIPNDQEYLKSYRLGLYGLIPPYVKEELGLKYENTHHVREGYIDYVRLALSSTPEHIYHTNGLNRVQFLQDYYLLTQHVILPYKEVGQG